MSQQSQKPRLTLKILGTTRSGGYFHIEVEAAVMSGRNPGIGEIELKLFGVDRTIPAPGEVQIKVGAVDHVKRKVLDREVVRLNNLKPGEYNIRATATVAYPNENTSLLLSCSESFTLVSPNVRLEVSPAIKIGNEWQSTATATAFVPGKNISAEDEEVLFFLDNAQVASGITNEAGIVAYDLRNLSEGSHLVKALLISTGRERQMTIQVGEKPKSAAKILANSVQGKGSAETTFFITVLNEDSKAVKDVVVRVLDRTLGNGFVDLEKTDSLGNTKYRGSVEDKIKFRMIKFVILGTDIEKVETLYGKSETSNQGVI